MTKCIYNLGDVSFLLGLAMPNKIIVELEEREVKKGMPDKTFFSIVSDAISWPHVFLFIFIRHINLRACKHSLLEITSR